MDEFINPKAALTPFVAGAIVTFLANTIWYAFGFPPIVTALALSILFGVLVVGKYKVSFFYKVIYFLLNSLIIFSLAYGNALIAKNITSKHEMVDYYNPNVSEIPTQAREYFVDWFNLWGLSHFRGHFVKSKAL